MRGRLRPIPTHEKTSIETVATKDTVTRVSRLDYALLAALSDKEVRGQSFLIARSIFVGELCPRGSVRPESDVVCRPSSNKL